MKTPNRFYAFIPIQTQIKLMEKICSWWFVRYHKKHINL